jgi:hypothetical protein
MLLSLSEVDCFRALRNQVYVTQRILHFQKLFLYSIKNKLSCFLCYLMLLLFRKLLKPHRRFTPKIEFDIRDDFMEPN